MTHGETSAEHLALVVQRMEDPDGEISPERMHRGFDVAEVMARCAERESR